MLKRIYLGKFLPYFPVLLLLLNLITKCWNLTSDAICLDEPFSIYHAQFDIPVMFRQLENYNNPPLFEFILHFWIKLLDISPLSVRLLPSLIASCCPVLLYYFARRNFSLQAALAGSLLLSFSGLLFSYAHDCRAYSLFLLLTLASFYYYLEIVNKERRTPLKQVLFVLFSSLLIYAHYFGFFVLLIQGIHLVLTNRKNVLTMGFHYLIILLLFIPCLFTMLFRFMKLQKVIGSLPLKV